MTYQAPATLAAGLFRRLARAPADGPALRLVLRLTALVPLVMAGFALCCALVPLQP